MVVQRPPASLSLLPALLLLPLVPLRLETEVPGPLGVLLGALLEVPPGGPQVLEQTAAMQVETTTTTAMATATTITATIYAWPIQMSKLEAIRLARRMWTLASRIPLRKCL